MASERDAIYGFSLETADALVAKIGQTDLEPKDFELPPPSGLRLYRFSLNEEWSSGAADADILLMDGTDTGVDADVLDPLGIFAELGNGDTGLCLLQGGSYYAIQAPCP